MKNKKLFNTEIVLLFCIIFASVAGVKIFSADNTPEIQTVPQSQYADWLYPGDHLFVSGNAFGGDTIVWDFVGSDDTVGIIAMAMDAENYLDFYYGYSFTYWPLSDGSNYVDSGVFNVPYSDEWYVVFDTVGIYETYLTYDGVIMDNSFGGTRIDYYDYGYSYLTDPLQITGTVDK